MFNDFANYISNNYTKCEHLNYLVKFKKIINSSCSHSSFSNHFLFLKMGERLL